MMRRFSVPVIFFQKKKYCPSGCFGTFFENDPAGKDLFQQNDRKGVFQSEAQKLAFLKPFSDKILLDKSSQQIRYELLATGQEDTWPLRQILMESGGSVDH